LNRIKRFASVRLDQAAASDHADNSRPQRHFVRRHDDVGATTFPPEHRDRGGLRPWRAPPISGSRLSASGRTPSAARRNAASNVPDNSSRNARSSIALGDHVGCLGPSGMAAARHDIGRAEIRGIAGLGSFARGFPRDRKFGDADGPAPNAFRTSGLSSSCATAFDIGVSPQPWPAAAIDEGPRSPRGKRQRSTRQSNASLKGRYASPCGCASAA